MVERYGDTQSSAGWVWAIVGIIVAALVVWWIAAAVSNNRKSSADIPTSQAVGATQGDDESSSNQPSEMVGGAEAPSEQARADQATPSEIQAFQRWNQQQQGDLRPESINEGMRHLNEATTGLMGLYQRSPTPGSQMGGGPDEGISQAVSAERERFDQAIDELQAASSADEPRAFKNAAGEFIALVDGIRGHSESAGGSDTSSDQSIKQLRQKVDDIDESRSLLEQRDDVRGFFSQSSEVLHTFAQNAQTNTQDR